MTALVLLLTLTANFVLAVEINIIYPIPPDSTKIYEFPRGLDSSFVLGNIKPATALLSVNGIPIVTTLNGAFLAFLPLQNIEGTNSWNFVLTEQGGAEIARHAFTYSIRSKASVDTSNSKRSSQVLRVIAPNAHTRTYPGGSYEFFPEIGTEFAGSGDAAQPFCHIDLGTPYGGAIESRFVETASVSEWPELRIGNGDCRDDRDSVVCHFKTTRAALVRPELSESRDKLSLWIADAQAGIDRIRFHNTDSYIKNIEWEREDGGLKLDFHLRSPLQRGYLVHSTADGLTITFYPRYGGRNGSLKGKTIAIDAGHGGSATGATGPLGTHEKDVTLRWSKLLENELIRNGARVVQTRRDDSDISLYDRIDTARGAHADFLISLHANALPDGENPFLRRGCGVYYYQPAARSAAEFVQQHLLKAAGLQNDGIFDANFAVVRPTDFPALLIEGAYLMQPDEEQLLLKDDFLAKMSTAIAGGLHDYFKAAR
jgi:N-acetylmuramoyl-L-alanine amidase